MTRRSIRILLSAAVFIILAASFCEAAPVASGAQDLEPGLREAFARKDYAKAASLIEAQIKLIGEASAKGDKAAAGGLIGKNHELAALYAWRLGRADEAIEIYRKTSLLPRPYPEENVMPSLEYLLIADIYEAKKDYPNALKHYNALLVRFEAQRPKKQVEELMGGEIKTLLKYRIDGINAAAGASQKPLLAKFRFSPDRTNIFSGLFMMSLLPGCLINESEMSVTNLPEVIRKSPKGIGCAFVNYYLMVNASAGTFNEASEKAAAAYLETYPDALPAFWLRHQLYAFYSKSGKPEKAAIYKEQIQKIGRQRGMEVFVAPDKRFSSPEATFATLKKAMSEGDIETISECYVPGRGMMPELSKTNKVMGKDVFKQLAETLVEIRRESGDGQVATYLMIRRVKGRETSGAYVIFNNVDGEWKFRE